MKITEAVAENGDLTMTFADRDGDPLHVETLGSQHNVFISSHHLGNEFTPADAAVIAAKTLDVAGAKMFPDVLPSVDLEAVGADVLKMGRALDLVEGPDGFDPRAVARTALALLAIAGREKGLKNVSEALAFAMAAAKAASFDPNNFVECK